MSDENQSTVQVLSVEHADSFWCLPQSPWQLERPVQERSRCVIMFWVFVWKQNEVQMWCETTELQLKDAQRRSTSLVVECPPALYHRHCLYAWCKQKEQSYCKFLETTKLYKAPSFSKLFFHSRQEKLPRAIKTKWILIFKRYGAGASVFSLLNQTKGTIYSVNEVNNVFTTIGY